MIFAGLATIQERETSLRTTVESLLPQVDALGVCLNGYDHIPDFLDDPKIRIENFETDDPGDAGKFHWYDQIDGFYLVCDDDLAYPSDYASTLVAALERHEREAIVGFGGRTINPEARRCIGDNYRALDPVEGEHQVHLLVTCAAGLHTSTLEPFELPHPNMADVWLAKAAFSQGVPMFVQPHTADWLQHTSHSRTIWSECTKRTGSTMDTREIQERILKETPWPQI